MIIITTNTLLLVFGGFNQIKEDRGIIEKKRSSFTLHVKIVNYFLHVLSENLLEEKKWGQNLTERITNCHHPNIS